jgi:cell division protein ZapA (FtsZ GTPase activity inhibitor)
VETAILVTAMGARTRVVGTNGNAPRIAYAAGLVTSRVGSCPTDCEGKCPCPTSLDLLFSLTVRIKALASILIWSVLALWAVLRVRLPVHPLNASSSHNTLRLQREQG